jgi:hypothetical protein
MVRTTGKWEYFFEHTVRPNLEDAVELESVEFRDYAEESAIEEYMDGEVEASVLLEGEYQGEEFTIQAEYGTGDPIIRRRGDSELIGVEILDYDGDNRELSSEVTSSLDRSTLLTSSDEDYETVVAEFTLGLSAGEPPAYLRDEE